MNRYMIILVLLFGVVSFSGGCSSLNSGWQDWHNNIPKLKADIFLFSQLATRLALNEADMSPNDIDVVEGYLVALRDLLVIPGHPNFDGARLLVSEKLPPKYVVYGLTIIDVLDRYIQAANLSVTEDQEAVMGIITSGINGAISAVREFT